MTSSILNSCTIALSGSYSVKHAVLIETIVTNGGIHAEGINNSITHLLATQDTVNHNPTKIRQARAIAHIKIVRVQWLTESVQAGAKLDETPYIIQPGVPTISAKRKVLESQSKLDADEPPPKKEKGVQHLGHEVEVPLDKPSEFPNGSWKVWSSASGLIFDATLTKVNVTENENKYCRLQLVVRDRDAEYRTWTRGGRLGHDGKHSILGNGNLQDARDEFEKAFKARTGLSWVQRLEPHREGKYVFVERAYSKLSSGKADASTPNPKNKKLDGSAYQPQSKLETPVQDVMKLLFKKEYFEATMTDMGFDVDKVPLGKLSSRSLNSGYECLKELGSLIANADDQTRATDEYSGKLEKLTNRYYTIIPHSSGMNRLPLIDDEKRLKRELGLLQALGDAEIATKILETAKAMSGNVNLLDRRFAALNLDMTPTDHESSEFKELQEYLLRSRGHTHLLTFKASVQNIFRISRHGEGERFAQNANLTNSERRLLWHGSRVTNFAGILNQGLRVAPKEAPSTGFMFGKGIYLADMSPKSANYCHPGQSNNTILLLLCEVEVGNPMHEPLKPDGNAAVVAQTGMKAAGKLSVLGKGRTGHKNWKDAQCVHPDLKGVLLPDLTHIPGKIGGNECFLLYNEYVVYDPSQIRLRYLVLASVS